MSTVANRRVAKDRAARIRAAQREGRPVSETERDFLASWDANKFKVGRPKKPLPPLDDQQPAAEMPAGGGADRVASSPESSPTSAPPAEPSGPSNPSIASPLEAPPSVAMPRTETSGAGGGGKDWRDKYRASGFVVDDGREMLCLQIANAMIGAVDAMNSDMKKAGIDPILESMGVTTRQLLPVYVLAWDEILPAKARMTPKIGMMVTSATVAGQRYYHHKKITAALKTDPETLEWKKKQAEREAREQAQRAANVEAQKSEGKVVQFAAPPPPPEPEAPSLSGKRTFEPQARATLSHIAADSDSDRLY
jgi:hypothetical protein